MAGGRDDVGTSENPEKPTFPFEKLPPELRCMVYEQVSILKDETDNAKLSSGKFTIGLLTLKNLGQASRRLRDETQSVYSNQYFPVYIDKLKVVFIGRTFLLLHTTSRTLPSCFKDIKNLHVSISESASFGPGTLVLLKYLASIIRRNYLVIESVRVEPDFNDCRGRTIQMHLDRLLVPDMLCS